MYKYEMHLHTNTCSGCGQSSAEEMILAAKKAGYSGIVLTNHFYHGNTAIDRSLCWERFLNAYVDEYVVAKKFGNSVDMDIFFGIEEGIGKGKEILIYGVSPKDYLDCTDFLNMNIYEISKFVRKSGGFIAMAHPFRHRSYITDPDEEPDTALFDAIEGYNQCNTAEDNEQALDFAKRVNIPVTAGSDIHHSSRYADPNFGGSGLAFYNRLYNDKELVKQLKSGNYRLIKRGEIV